LRGLPSAAEEKHRLSAFRYELLDVVEMGGDCFGDLTGRCVAEADLNHLWRMTANQRPREEITVLGDDEETGVFGERPDSFVVVTGEPVIATVAATRESVRETVDEPIRRVLVKQRLHATDPGSRRSRSAANARQARMSSLVSSGSAEDHRVDHGSGTNWGRQLRFLTLVVPAQPGSRGSPAAPLEEPQKSP
jgi:hypothetical protein